MAWSEGGEAARALGLKGRTMSMKMDWKRGYMTQTIEKLVGMSSPGKENNPGVALRKNSQQNFGSPKAVVGSEFHVSRSPPYSRKALSALTANQDDAWRTQYRPCKIIAIDGNIGSGKSTLLRMLKKQYQQISSSEKVVCFATERTHEWKAMLPMYYQDTERWSFPFQMQVLLSHIRNFQEAIRQKADVLFVERSPLAAKYVFGEVLRQEGLISELEADLFDDYMSAVAWKPDVLLYLDSSPEQCMERIQKRNVTGDSGVPLDYLQKLTNAYETFIHSYEGKMPVKRLNSNLLPAEVCVAATLEINKFLNE